MISLLRRPGLWFRRRDFPADEHLANLERSFEQAKAENAREVFQVLLGHELADILHGLMHAETDEDRLLQVGRLRELESLERLIASMRLSGRQDGEKPRLGSRRSRS